MEDEETANSEIRCITIELMKIAKKSGKDFETIALEFADNTSRLEELLRKRAVGAGLSGNKREKAQKADNK